MPTTETYYCTDCQVYKRAYNSEPTRCWDCEKYTLVRTDLAVRQVGQSVATSSVSRARLAGEMANWCKSSGDRYEYEAKVEVTKDSSSCSIKCRPFVPPKQ